MGLFFYVCAVYRIIMVLIGMILATVTLVITDMISNTVGRVFPKVTISLRGYFLKVWKSFYMIFAPKTKFNVCGDILNLRNEKRRSIVLFNHQTFFDWGFIWCFMKYFGCEERVCIILKKSLGNIPILGNLMTNAGFCYVEREWAKDRLNIEYFWDHTFSKSDYPRMLIMFPEGTTRDVNSLKRSREWAANNDRPQLQYLLLPRTTGLCALIEKLRDDDEQKGYQSYICDCTMQFSTYSGEAPGELGEGRIHDSGIPEIMTFLCPKQKYECFIHYSYTPVSDVLPSTITDPEDIRKCVEKWVDQRWVEKEHELQHFIDHGEYSEEWMQNKVSYEHTFLQYVIDTRYWLLPAVVIIGVIYAISKAVTVVFKKLLEYTMIASIYAIAMNNLYIVIPCCIVVVLLFLFWFYKKAIYSTHH